MSFLKQILMMIKKMQNLLLGQKIVKILICKKIE